MLQIAMPNTITSISDDNLQSAEKIIKLLRDQNITDFEQLPFIGGIYYSGDAKLRQAIIYKCSGILQPLSKCTLAMTGEYLKGELMKTQLF